MRALRGLLCLLAVAVAALVWSVPRPAAAAPPLPSSAGWPLAGTVHVLRGFDPPRQPFGPGHRGVDLASSPGAPVLAAAAGRVSFAGPIAGRGVVVVDHGLVRTTYEPVEPLVVVGERVAMGTVLGRLGVEKHCAGEACLHWGLKQGTTYLDPLLLVHQGQIAGPVRLLPASAREVVQRRAAQRRVATAAAAAAVASIAPGPGGRHGFAHPVPGTITSAFGMRFHPILHVWKLHDGTDFGAACGTPIRAPYSGRVSQVSYNPGYGNRLMLDHGVVDGFRVGTGYNHALRYVVGPGDRVTRGQVIGYAGSTGFATGCHLHLMVWLNGRLTDPMTWFQ